MKTKVIIGLCAITLIGLFVFKLRSPETPTTNTEANTSQQPETIVGITAEHLCADGQVKDRSFTGAEYVFSSCHALPSDYKKTCTSSIDCTNRCITTLDLATTAGCTEANNQLKAKCSMTGFCSATYDSGGFIELVSGVPTLRVDE